MTNPASHVPAAVKSALAVGGITEEKLEHLCDALSHPVSGLGSAGFKAILTLPEEVVVKRFQSLASLGALDGLTLSECMETAVLQVANVSSFCETLLHHFPGALFASVKGMARVQFLDHAAAQLATTCSIVAEKATADALSRYEVSPPPCARAAPPPIPAHKQTLLILLTLRLHCALSL